MDVSEETIGLAMAAIPSGCSILTVAHEDRSTGLLVSWVQQAAFEPLSVSVALKHGRPVLDLLEKAQTFVLNVVGEDPTLMFKHFGKGYSLDEDAFDGIDVRMTPFGPVVESCMAHLGCRVTGKLSVGDHTLYVGEVAAAGVVDGAKPYTHIRKSGLSY